MKQLVQTITLISLLSYTMGCAKAEWKELYTMPDGSKEYLNQGSIEKNGSFALYQIKDILSPTGNSTYKQEVARAVGGNPSEIHTTILLNCESQQAATKEMKVILANGESKIVFSANSPPFQQVETDSPTWRHHYPLVCGNKVTVASAPLRSQREDWRKVSSTTGPSTDFIDQASIHKSGNEITIHVKTMFDESFQGKRSLNPKLQSEKIVERRSVETYNCKNNTVRLSLIEEYGVDEILVSRLKEGAQPVYDPIPPNSGVAHRKSLICK